MALTLYYCSECHGGIVMSITVGDCPMCGKPTRWLLDSPNPIRPFKLTKKDAAWLRHARIAVDTADLAALRGQ